jgi:hypothetical protein
MTRRTSVRLGRKLVAVASASAIAAGLCGVYASNAAASGSGNLNITFNTFDDATLVQGLDAWEAINDGVNVSAADVSNGNTYPGYLLSAKDADNEADINEAYDTLTPTLEVEGTAGDLKNELVTGKIYPQSYWYHSFLASYIPPHGAVGVTVGDPYGVPLEADATVIIYNENEFKKAHVPFPKDGWTWGQMLKDAKKLTKGHGVNTTQYGICLRPDWQAEYNPVLHAYGVTAFTETKATLDTAAAKAAWKLMLAPMEKGIAEPESVIGQTHEGDCGTPFEAGTDAMALAVRGGTSGYAAEIGNKFKWNVVTMPTIKVGKKKPDYPVGGGSVSFTMAPATLAGGPDLSNAESFMKFLFSAPGQKVLEDTFGVIPSVPSLNGPHAEWRHLAGGPGPNESFPTNNNAWTIDAAKAIIAPQTPGTVANASNTDVPAFVANVVGDPSSLNSQLATLQSEMTAAY